jgi:E3 ubiquitin-protein ligase UBR3
MFMNFTHNMIELIVVWLTIVFMVHRCEESSDLDLYLLQCCAVMAPPEDFVNRIIARFGLLDYFSLFLLRPNEY